MRYRVVTLAGLVLGLTLAVAYNANDRSKTNSLNCGSRLGHVAGRLANHDDHKATLSPAERAYLDHRGYRILSALFEITGFLQVMSDFPSSEDSRYVASRNDYMRDYLALQPRWLSDALYQTRCPPGLDRALDQFEADLAALDVDTLPADETATLGAVDALMPVIDELQRSREQLRQLVNRARANPGPDLETYKSMRDVPGLAPPRI